MSTIYRLTWTDRQGESRRMEYSNRKRAIVVLNILILDYGFTDARLRVVSAGGFKLGQVVGRG